MTNSRLAFAEGSLFITSKSFVKYLFTLAFILMAFLPQVNAAITVTSTPNTNNDFCGSGGPTLTLPVVATSGCGAGTITYKWYVGSVIPANQITSSGAPNYSGYTTSTLFVGTASALGSNTAFYAVLSESSGACSDIDTIGPFNFTKVSSTPTLSITSSPLDVCQNSTASYTVNVTAPSPAGTLTYNWYNAPSGGGFGFVQNSSSASTTSSYSYTARATDDQDRVFVDVSNACGTTRSDTVTLDVNPTPIVTVPGSMSTLTACEGDGFNVSYTIDTAEYQNRVGSVNWTLTASGDAALISLLTTAGNGNTAVNLVGIGGALTPGVYSATFTLATNTTESCSRSISTNTINVTIYPKPTITFEISPSDYCRETDTTSFKIRVSNASYNNGASTVNVNWSASITEQSVNVTGGCTSGSAGLLGATLTGTGNGTFYYYPSTNLSPGTYTYKINSVTNTTNACVGSVTGTDSIGWTVFPRPSIAVAPTSTSV
ncbi:MAG: hypothetical protein KDC76_08175, partial [Bacteroidetes bacterium]|nr:hypothetical protein [Bacteroidota bacterium]